METKPCLLSTCSCWAPKERLTTDQSRVNGINFLIKIRGALLTQFQDVLAASFAVGLARYVWAGVRAKTREVFFLESLGSSIQHPEFKFCDILAWLVRPWAASPLTYECLCCSQL